MRITIEEKYAAIPMGLIFGMATKQGNKYLPVPQSAWWNVLLLGSPTKMIGNVRLVKIKYQGKRRNNA